MKRTAIPVLDANAFDGLSITDSDLHSKYFGTPRLTSFSMKSKSRSLFYIIPVAFLLFCSTNAGNSLVHILPADHREISLNCYTAQFEPLPYLQ